jgi:hypothetical protein
MTTVTDDALVALLTHHAEETYPGFAALRVRVGVKLLSPDGVPMFLEFGGPAPRRPPAAPAPRPAR